MQPFSIFRSLLLVPSLLVSGSLFSQTGSSRIQLNQLGFYPHAPKLAVITGNTGAQRFYVINSATKDTVFTGALSAEKQSANSSTVTRQAHFSLLQKSGTFYIDVPGVGQSYPF